MGSRITLVGGAVLLLLNACATTVTPRTEIQSRALLEERHVQRSIALEQNVKDSNRLHDVSFPLLQAALPFCTGQVVFSIGLDVATAYDFEESYQRSASEVLHLDTELAVIHATQEGPAANAGIEDGDIITAINGNFVVTGPNASAVFANLLEEEMASGAAVVISVRRGEEEQSYSMTPVSVCDYGINLVLQDALNAYADGNQVYITRRMLRFTDSDKELALVIAHELAHNTMRHSSKRRQNRWFGTVIDLAANSKGWDTGGYFGDLTSQAYSQDFEAEADYVGMYILARTGTDLDGASNFWRRMAIESPANIDSHSSSHPATAERFLALEKTAQEIRDKQEAGIQLNPDLKKDADNED